MSTVRETSKKEGGNELDLPHFLLKHIRHLRIPDMCEDLILNI